jgi:hypothetical protein
MGDYRDGDGSAESTVRLWASGLRVAGTVLGIIIIIVGLVFAIMLFEQIYSTLKSPEGFDGAVRQWIPVVGGEDVEVEVEGRPVPVARLMAIVILGGGTVLLVWIAMGFMLTGARIVSWTTSDREAIKKILKYAFGSARRPPPQSGGREGREEELPLARVVK